MNLETDRLLVRKFEKDDLHAVLEYTSNHDVMRYIPEGVFNEEDAAAFLRDNIGVKPQKFASCFE
jgi:[ribosomal protein S5]-alanine N-acetyltransferase